MQSQMPKLSPIPSSESWVLLEEWHYTALDGERYSVPAGFVTDLDSVPRIPVVYAMYKGRIRAAAVLHDWLYRNAYPRNKADRLLAEAGELLDGVSQDVAEAIYTGVHLFGWAKYKAKKHAELVVMDSIISGSTATDKKAKWVPPASAAPYLDAINKAELKHSLPENLLARLLHQESHYRQDVITGAVKSPAGAEGIAQIMRKYHPSVEPLDPFASIDYAAEYLAELKQRFGNWRDALAAYNWGMGNVGRAKDNHGSSWLSYAPEETQNYVKQITADVRV
ncbi:lytic transglycosylase domain-containing protein [Marinomonas atlantica]|uniref:lytic transglycosylase domain-containing protein n=1 Tax=Marinomonas atlantica TaxID=1806668 RepID=UPI0008377C84|nr:DUF1353 domain-containing protein [Marinomonas atlantica]